MRGGAGSGAASRRRIGLLSFVLLALGIGLAAAPKSSKRSTTPLSETLASSTKEGATPLAKESASVAAATGARFRMLDMDSISFTDQPPLPHYSVRTIRLTGVPEGSVFEPRLFNNKGDIAGTLRPYSAERARLTKPVEVVRRADGRLDRMTVPTTLPSFGSTEVVLTDLDNAGYAVGAAVAFRRGEGDIVHVLRLSPDGVQQDLGSLWSSREVTAPQAGNPSAPMRTEGFWRFSPRINAQGRITVMGGESAQVWEAGRARTLGSGMVVDLSDAGHMVGVSRMVPGGAALWEANSKEEIRPRPLLDPRTTVEIEAALQLPETVALRGAAESVNNRGLAVIQLELQSIPPWRRRALYLVCDGKQPCRQIGVFAGNQRSPKINAAGQVVGLVHRGADPEQRRAVLWDDGRYYDLNDRVERNTGWRIQDVIGINDRGQMLAVGVHPQQKNSLLVLTPEEARGPSGAGKPAPARS